MEIGVERRVAFTPSSGISISWGFPREDNRTVVFSHHAELGNDI